MVVIENLGPLVRDTFEAFIMQNDSRSSATLVKANVPITSRFVEKREKSSHEKKTKVISTLTDTSIVDSLTGESSYQTSSGGTYFSRKWNEHSDVLTLRKSRQLTSTPHMSPMFTLLYGAPGCGKTALVEAAFSDPGDLYTILGTGDTEVSDMIGSYIQTKEGSFEWVDGDLVKAAETGGVYFIDEIGLIDPKVLSVVYGLMDGRRELTITANPDRGTIKAHPNFYVVAATNPNAPGVRLSEALLSRFAIQVELTTDYQLAKKMGVPPTLISIALNLKKKQDNGEIRWSPQMRELLAFKDISSGFGLSFAISNLIAAAPESDRLVIADVMSRAFGVAISSSKI